MSTLGAQTQSMETQAGLRRPWYVVFALTAIYMLSYVDRVIFSLLAPMKRDLGISDTRVGLLQGWRSDCSTPLWACRSAASRIPGTGGT